LLITSFHYRLSLTWSCYIVGVAFVRSNNLKQIKNCDWQDLESKQRTFRGKCLQLETVDIIIFNMSWCSIMFFFIQKKSVAYRLTFSSDSLILCIPCLSESYKLKIHFIYKTAFILYIYVRMRRRCTCTRRPLSSETK
jgi:hypothetical protein